MEKNIVSMLFAALGMMEYSKRQYKPDEEEHKIAQEVQDGLQKALDKLLALEPF